eukprot:m.59378 g.59378  ORF g.59378 m.59378 type:complete len:727 (+) comp11242_c0_seq1:433-2613(+)
MERQIQLTEMRLKRLQRFDNPAKYKQTSSTVSKRARLPEPTPPLSDDDMDYFSEDDYDDDYFDEFEDDDINMDDEAIVGCVSRELQESRKESLREAIPQCDEEELEFTLIEHHWDTNESGLSLINGTPPRNHNNCELQCRYCESRIRYDGYSARQRQSKYVHCSECKRDLCPQCNHMSHGVLPCCSMQTILTIKFSLGQDPHATAHARLTRFLRVIRQREGLAIYKTTPLQWDEVNIKSAVLIAEAQRTLTKWETKEYRVYYPDGTPVRMTFDTPKECNVCNEVVDLRRQSVPDDSRTCYECLTQWVLTGVRDNKLIIHLPQDDGSNGRALSKKEVLAVCAGDQQAIDLYKSNIPNDNNNDNNNDNDGAKLMEEFDVQEAGSGHHQQKCPSCHHGIYKHEGCDNMTCSCGYVFNWRRGEHGELAPRRRRQQQNEGIMRVSLQRGNHATNNIHIREAVNEAIEILETFGEQTREAELFLQDFFMITNESEDSNTFLRFLLEGETNPRQRVHYRNDDKRFLVDPAVINDVARVGSEFHLRPASRSTIHDTIIKCRIEQCCGGMTLTDTETHNALQEYYTLSSYLTNWEQSHVEGTAYAISTSAMHWSTNDNKYRLLHYRRALSVLFTVSSAKFLNSLQIQQHPGAVMILGATSPEVAEKYRRLKEQIDTLEQLTNVVAMEDETNLEKWGRQQGIAMKMEEVKSSHAALLSNSIQECGSLDCSHPLIKF